MSSFLTAITAAQGRGLPVTVHKSSFDPDWLCPVDDHGTRQPTKLYQALLTAANAEDLIGPEVERLTKLHKAAVAKGDKTEIEAREYQIWYVEAYLKRAARIARLRLEHFEKIRTEADANEENDRCSRDVHHWFKYYAWGYDPRARTPLSVVPFELHPRQSDLVAWLDDLVFERRTSGLIEKARDEGATELIVRWGIHRWRYRDGFSMLLSSRTEDEVDTKKKQGTLFERARFQIRLLPQWMLPERFDVERDMLADKLIANPQNGNSLQGSAPVENIGRGDRVTCAMFDEFAFWRFAGYPQFTSMSQTTDSILMPSSVAGKLNQYADLAFDGVTPKFEMDWRDNPFKDERWYNSLPYGYIGPKMSSTTIAQEVDRNYEASQPGKVWKYSEPHMFITWKELVAYFKKFGLEQNFFHKGRYSIPVDWKPTRTHDYGQTDGHEWAYLIGAQPREAYPLHDTHFIFLGRNLEPTGLTEQQAVQQWREWEIELGLRNEDKTWRNKPRASWHSHEQKELRKVLLNTYGETWLPWNTDYDTGLSTVQDWFNLVDKDKPNPFRPRLMGRTKIVFVAPDDEYVLAFNERLKTWFVTTSATEAGFFTLRRQIGSYHYPITELGKAVKDMRPEKVFDDIVDTLRGYAVNWNRDPEGLTESETIEKHMPEGYTMRELMAKSPYKKGLTDQQQLARSLMEQEVREKLNMPAKLPAWIDDDPDGLADTGIPDDGY